MNAHLENSSDPLKDFLLSGNEEKAPEDFTGRVMNMISLEPRPARPAESRLKRNPVPLISIGVAVILVILVLIMPSSGYEIALPGWVGVISRLKPLPEIFSLDSILRIDLPGFLPYMFLCILILTLIDRGLNGLFHRGR